MKIIYHGHSCVELQLQNGLKLIFDPFITNNPQSDITVDYPVDFILVSHGHTHHTGDMITLSKKNKAPIIAVPELTYYAEKESAITYPINLGGSANLPFGFVKMMHAQHSSSINVDGKLKYAGDAAGFLIKADNKTIFFAGDTSNFGDMAIFGKAFDIDVAFLPIGGRFTMGPAEAAICGTRLNSKYVVPIHYNTFPEIQQNPDDLVTKLPQGVVKILTPGQNGTFDI